MQKRLHIKSKQLKKVITENGRKGARKDFFELLLRSIQVPQKNK